MKPEKPQDDSSPDGLGECAPNGSSLGSEPLPPKLQSVAGVISNMTITSSGAAFAKKYLHMHEQLHAARMMEYINTTDHLTKDSLQVLMKFNRMCIARYKHQLGMNE